MLCYGFGNWDWRVKALSAYARVRLLVFLCIFLKASPKATFIIVRLPIYDDNVKLAIVVFVLMGILFFFLIAYFLS